MVLESLTLTGARGGREWDNYDTIAPALALLFSIHILVSVYAPCNKFLLKGESV